jgi:hypothetical protein
LMMWERVLKLWKRNCKWVFFFVVYSKINTRVIKKCYSHIKAIQTLVERKNVQKNFKK